MPIYEYCCEKCHEREEVMQKIGEAPPEICSHCGAKHTLSKAVSSSAFHLKGGGWYKDLYASKKKEGSTSESTSPKKDEKKGSD